MDTKRVPGQCAWVTQCTAHNAVLCLTARVFESEKDGGAGKAFCMTTHQNTDSNDDEELWVEPQKKDVGFAELTGPHTVLWIEVADVSPGKNPVDHELTSERRARDKGTRCGAKVHACACVIFLHGE